MEPVEDIKSFKLRSNTTISNVAFNQTHRKLIDKKLMMEPTLYSNCAYFLHRPNIKKIFLGPVEDIESFKLRPIATISNLAFRIKPIRKMIDKQLLTNQRY